MVGVAARRATGSNLSDTEARRIAPSRAWQFRDALGSAPLRRGGNGGGAESPSAREDASHSPNLGARWFRRKHWQGLDATSTELSALGPHRHIQEHRLGGAGACDGLVRVWRGEVGDCRGTVSSTRIRGTVSGSRLLRGERPWDPRVSRMFEVGDSEVGRPAQVGREDPISAAREDRVARSKTSGAGQRGVASASPSEIAPRSDERARLTLWR